MNFALLRRRKIGIFTFFFSIAYVLAQEPAPTKAVPADSSAAQEAQSEPGVQQPSPEPDTGEAETSHRPPLNPKLTTKQQAWEVLKTGLADNNNRLRATAVAALGLLGGQPEVIAMASQALGDKKPEVRAAAAKALGEMLARSAIPKLRQALSDTEPSVVFAAAHALVLLKDNQGYDVYYEVLTGERKPGKGFIAGQLDTFKDPKKLAAFSLQQGIGFVPFGGYGYTAVKMLLKDDTSPVRASAARVLADDPDPKSQDALARVAVEDKHEIVRIAALEAIAHHGNPALIAKIAPAMSDSKDAVSYTAAAAVLHLTDIAETKRPHKKTSRGRAD